MPLLLPGIAVHPGFQNPIRDLIAQRPAQARSRKPLQRIAHHGPTGPDRHAHNLPASHR